jgi:MtN3 and saliva related transmembrane protein
MTLSSTVGYIAGTLTTISFLPQVIKIWQTKSTKDVSLVMFLVFSAGVFLWLIYGLLLERWPIIIPNFITLVLAGTILKFKLRYG